MLQQGRFTFSVDLSLVSLNLNLPNNPLVYSKQEHFLFSDNNSLVPDASASSLASIVGHPPGSGSRRI